MQEWDTGSKMKSRIFTAFALFIVVLSIVSSGSVFMFAMFDSTTSDSLTINNGDSEGLTVSADSIFEDSMRIKVHLIDGGVVIATLLDTTTSSDSYSKHLTITDDIYRNTGTYTIMSTVTASSGQTSEKELTLRVIEPASENNVPEITSSPVTQVNESAQYNYQVIAVDGDGDSLTYSLTQNPSWLSINSGGLISGTAPSVASNTQYVVTIEVSDGQDFDRQTYSIDVLNIENNDGGEDDGNQTNGNQTSDTTSPAVSILSPVDGQTYSSDQNVIVFTATDQNLDSCWYSLNNGQTNVTTQCNTAITGINSQTGQNTWTVYANDTAGNTGSDTVTFTVNAGTSIVEDDDESSKVNYDYQDPSELEYLEQLEQKKKVNKGDSFDLTGQKEISFWQKFWNWLKSLFGF